MVLILLTGRSYEAETCVILLFPMDYIGIIFSAKVVFLRFWPKTMDYNQRF